MKKHFLRHGKLNTQLVDFMSQSYKKAESDDSAF